MNHTNKNKNIFVINLFNSIYNKKNLSKINDKTMNGELLTFISVLYCLLSFLIFIFKFCSSNLVFICQCIDLIK